MQAVATRVVPARLGLVGNPSDGYGGAVLAVPFPRFAATVAARPATGVTITGPEVEHRWPSAAEFVASVTRHGHPPEQGIVSAPIARVLHHLARAPSTPADVPGDVPGDDPTGVEVTWSTTVPRSVGLAGSSALAVATIGAVAACRGRSLDPRVVAALALAAELHDLGIAAGWQDRIVQAVGRPVLVDVARMSVCDGLEVPRVRLVDPPRPITLVVGWSAHAAAGSGAYHGAIRSRAASLEGPMRALGELARRAADALAGGDVERLADLVDRTWSLRRSAVPIRPDHAELVECVRRCGVAATTPGSGGAVVAVPLDRVQSAAVTAALSEAGAVSCTADVVPGPPSRPSAAT